MVNYNEIFDVSDSYQVPNKLMEILFDKEKREVLFMKLLRANNMNVDFDWFYEYFQNEHADRKVKKQDFTPECICDLVSKLVMNSKGDNGNYYEICAGTGGMMIKHWDNFRKTFSSFDYEPKYHFAFVEELSDRTVPFLLLNMMIRGMNGIVIHGNSLTRECKNAYFICNTKNDPLQFSGISVIPHNDLFEKELMVHFTSKKYKNHLELTNLSLHEIEGKLTLFDRIIANPPYSLKNWGREEASTDEFGRFHFGLPPANFGDYAFVQHILATLNHTGKAGVVLPHGILFRGKAEGKIRQELIKEDLIEAIIGLPSALFYKTNISVIIIIYNKDKEEKRKDKIFFIDASLDYQKEKNQNVLRDEDVEKIISTFNNYEEIEKYSRIVTLDEIKENDYNLNIPRYIDATEDEQIDVVQAIKELQQLEQEREKIEATMYSFLKELGYCVSNWEIIKVQDIGQLHNGRVSEILSSVDVAIEKTEQVIAKTEEAKKGLMQQLLTKGIGHTKFKQTEIGEIPVEWEIINLENLVEILDGKRKPIKKADRVSGSYPYYGATGIIDWVNDYIFDDDLILVGEDGNNLKSRLLPMAFKISGKTWVNNHAHVLKTTTKINIDFLVNWLEFIDYTDCITGTAQPKLNQQQLKRIKVVCPNLDEQIKIAAIINDVDTKLASERKYIDNLINLKQDIMQQLLTGQVRVKVD